jgi:hypothetical protein
MRLALLLVCLLSACSASCRRGTSDEPPESPRSATCTVPGVERAQRVELVTLPRGCAFTYSGSTTPRVLTTTEELTAALRCEEGVAMPTIDMSARDVYVVGYTMSPASVGNETVDDGTTVTFISRFRHNCPEDPMPMPMNVTYGFFMPKGATRAYREASCSLPEDC